MSGLVVVNCGNHWLQTDQHCTDPVWVDLAHASHHTREWAEQFATTCPHKQFTILSVEYALQEARHGAESSIKRAWLYAFESKVRRELVKPFTKEGMWTRAHMYYGRGISVSAAVQEWNSAT